MTITKTTGPRKTAHATRGVDLTSPRRSSEHQLPHERDQAVGATDGVPDEHVRQGYRDVVRGVTDTSRGVEADVTYRALKRKGHATRAGKRR